MATTDNASTVKAIYDAFNARDFDRLASYAAPDARATSIPFGATGGFREDFETWGKAFPDGNVEVKNLIAQGDQVVAEVVGRGTHQGTLSGPTGDIPATGRRVELPLAEIYRLRDGKIVELRYYFDAFTFLSQLGIGAPERGAEARRGTSTAQPQR
jgi:steroid delta-isomerase-like uncharacterized protein